MMKTICAVTLLLAAALDPHEPGHTFRSGPTRSHLLELYTSEGCSSCPPADAWLNGLADSPGLWRDFVPVAFHVTYWDSPGWKDPFASRLFTRRQYDYARRWGRQRVYTPCFVLNGQEWRPGEPMGKDGETAGVLTVHTDGHWARVTFAPPKDAQGPHQAWVAPMRRQTTSKVTAGENAGRTLRHGFVALSVDSRRMRLSDGIYTARLLLHHPKEADALAVWVTRGPLLVPVQATGGFIGNSRAHGGDEPE